MTAVAAVAGVTAVATGAGLRGVGGATLTGSVELGASGLPTKFVVLALDQVSDSTAAVALELELPAGAIVADARVEIEARPAGRTAIGNLATVRPASGASAEPTKELVVDFGGLRTVSTISTPSSLTGLRPWLGTGFPSSGELVPSGPLRKGEARTEFAFTEVATERLLVSLAGAVTPAGLAAAGRITQQDPPADLEVVVGGEQVDFRPGPVRGSGSHLLAEIDITAAVQRAVAASAVPVSVELRSSLPAQLTITQARTAYLHAHTVAFPEGGRRTLPVPEEGTVPIALPLTARPGGVDPANWRITLVRFELSGDVGEVRVVPAVGPAIDFGGEVLVDADRPVVVRLPPSALRRLGRVDGIRLLLRGEQATELAGFLRGGAAVPGDELPGGQLAPTTVEPSAEAGWVTLPLARALPADATGGMWAVVQVTRGRVALMLAAAGQPDDEGLIRRQAPNGSFRALPTVEGLSTTATPIRVVGAAPPTAPIDAVVVSVPGTARPTVAGTPTTSAVTHELPLADGVTTADTAARVGADLVLQLSVSGPGTYTIGPVVVGYEEIP